MRQRLFSREHTLSRAIVISLALHLAGALLLQYGYTPQEVSIGTRPMAVRLVTRRESPVAARTESSSPGETTGVSAEAEISRTESSGPDGTAGVSAEALSPTAEETSPSDSPRTHPSTERRSTAGSSTTEESNIEGSGTERPSPQGQGRSLGAADTGETRQGAAIAGAMIGAEVLPLRPFASLHGAWGEQSLPAPTYPDVARRFGYEGSVLLEILIAPSGDIRSVTIIESRAHGILEQCCLDTIREKWKFLPPGREIRTRKEFIFRLHK